jgi:hypothetical protein
MNWLKAFTVVFCLTLALGALAPAARADEWNQRMGVRFNQPIQVPGAVLAPGSYWFVLANFEGNRQVMQIFSHDWSTLYSTTVTNSTIREEPHSRIEVELAERPGNQPPALLKLFYPGLQTGHEFVYHRKEERELKRDARLDLLSRPHGSTQVITPGL